MGRVFISYSHEDAAKAQRIRQRLDEFGFSTWIDSAAPATRDDISSVIDREIDSVDSVLVLWSGASRGSVWVRGEALSGLTRNKYFGLLLDPMVPPVPFNAMVAPDLSDWTGLNSHLGWDALVRGLAAMSESSASIIERLAAEQKRENDETAKIESAQQRLPLDITAEPLDQGPAYIDVQSIMSSAKTILSGAAKLDLGSTLVQAALDQEMFRDAAYVVSKVDSVPQPRGARFKIVASIGAALKDAKEDDLIVVTPGIWEESLTISKNIRLVGIGRATEKPTIRAADDRSAVAFSSSARLENFSIETRRAYHAIHCGSGQPVILRCDIRRFSDQTKHQALYVAGRANPIVIACSITATGCPAVYTVQRSGGEFLGVHIISVRGNAVYCGGRAIFKGCTIEATGAHAVEVPTNGAPDFEECEISGRGNVVVRVAGNSYPRVKESRVRAIRQLAFDFEQNASGRIEGNIISVEKDAEAGTGRKAKSVFFGLLKSKEDAIVKAAINRDDFFRVRGEARTIFISNTTPDGEALDASGPSRTH